MFGFYGECGEEKGECDQGKVFDAPEVGGFGAAAEDEAGQQNEVREGEESEGDPKIEEEMVVERGAVGAGVGGQEPWGEQHGEARRR